MSYRTVALSVVVGLGKKTERETTAATQNGGPKEGCERRTTCGDGGCPSAETRQKKKGGIANSITRGRDSITR